MADQQQLAILEQGPQVWNRWRKINPDTRIDLGGANLMRTFLSGADFSGADFSGAFLNGAGLNDADFTGANLMRAFLSGGFLIQSNFTGANLTGANLTGADLTGANLTGADLNRAILVQTNMTRSILTNCRIYGISAWDLQVEEMQQLNLIITPGYQPDITVDNLEVAQFIYLLLNNKKIRDVIDTITSKVVLILGRFTPERKAVLDALRDELRKYNYLPVVFDFNKPTNRDLTETVATLAHLARFLIVDLTDPSSAPHEMATLAPQCIVPIQPLLIQDDTRYEYAMFQDLRQRYHWVLPTYRYQDTNSLLAVLKDCLITPAERKAQELEQRKQEK